VNDDPRADPVGEPQPIRAADVSVVIPASDGPATLERCLAAVESSTVRVGEVLVVRDRTASNAAEARNLGVERSSGSAIVFVDADVVVHPDAIARLLLALERDPKAVAAFGAYDESPGGAGPIAGFRYLLHHHVHLTGAGECDTFWTGLGAVRRDAFLQAGGFDSERRWMEDVDLGLRLTDRGGRILCEPGARGQHLKDLGLAEMLRTDVFRRAVPWVELMLERRSVSSGLNLSRRNRFQALVSGAFFVAAVGRRPRTALGLIVVFALLDLPFLRTVARARGKAQAALALPLHLLHHIAGLAGLVIGLARHGPAAIRSGKGVRRRSRSGRPRPADRFPS